MARPKKSPRERLQITLPKMIARELRAHAKKHDAELSTVIANALALYLPGPNVAPLETRAVLFAQGKPTP